MSDTPTCPVCGSAETELANPDDFWECECGQTWFEDDWRVQRIRALEAENRTLQAIINNYKSAGTEPIF